MKTLYESLLDDLDTLSDKADESLLDSMKNWINSNYHVVGLKISENTTEDGKLIVNCTRADANKYVKSLTNGMFVWGEVADYFYCAQCRNLTSLEGAPKKVGGTFDCCLCPSLKSLEGAPEKVGGDFICHTCNSLKSLEGAPNEVIGNFTCHRCSSLKTLKGAPKKVGYIFDCEDCPSLESYDDAPKNCTIYK